MADDPVATAGKAGKGGLSFLTQKVGPLPLGIWLVAGLVIYLYFQRQQSSSSAGANQQTDPAGNVGTIDPATGYVSGSPEDEAALAADNSGSTGTGSAGQGATSGGQAYADNNAWGIAAINFLVGLGVDATTANQAIEQYLSSQTLTTAQQGDVNLAIQALGPPPSLPGPVTGTPTPVTTPPGGGTTTPPAGGGGTTKPTAPPGGKSGTPPVAPPGSKKKTVPAPTGLTVSAKHSTSLSVKWNRVTGATGYHVLCTDMATKKIAHEGTVSSATASTTIGGLTPSHSYVVDVWAEPEAGAVGSGPHAEVSATLPRTG